VLEGVAVVGDVVVVVVGVGEEAVATGEDIARGEVGGGEECALGIGDLEDLLGVVVQVLAELVAQVGVGVLVALDAHGVLAPDATVVGGEDDVVVRVGEGAEQVCHGAVAEPAECDAAVGGLVAGQLANHTALGAGVAEHVNEVEDAHVDIIFLHLRQLLHETLGSCGVVDLVIGEGVLAAVALEERLYERRLVEVLALLAVLIDPQVREHLGDDVWHQAREDGVARILRGRGQDGTVEALVDMEEVGNLVHQDAPLVVAEVIDDDEEHLLAFVQEGEDAPLEDVGAHDGRATGRLGIVDPIEVVFLDETGKKAVSLLLLHGQHLLHAAVGFRELQLPCHEAAIDFHPVIDAAGVVDEHTHLSEVLLVGGLRLFRDNLALVDVLLQRQQDLRGVHGFDEVVGNLAADGLVHDVLLLALGDHHHGCRGRHLLDALQRLQAAEARHVLIEEDEVVGLLAATVDGVEAVGDGIDRVAFLFQKEDMSLQQLYLIVDPK